MRTKMHTLLLTLTMLLLATISYAQPRIDNTNAFAWDANNQGSTIFKNFEVNIDFTPDWIDVGTTTQYPVPSTLSPQFHTIYVRACGPTHLCSDPVSLGFVYVIVAPGTPMMPTGLRIIILATPSSQAVQPTPTSLPEAKKVKE